MPRFKAVAKLERTAVADLWKHTLSRIPTVSGRLAYLATLRDPASGTYRHHGLFASFGRDEAVRALRESHQKEFQAWLNLPLAEKSDDLREYLVRLEDPLADVVDHWIKSATYRSYVPGTARDVEAELFYRDLEILLAFLRHDTLRLQRRSDAGSPGRDSSLPV